ncbi:pyruvate kinase [Plasmopara halstedii]|uniref:Pyruvate kinase n=1 Tax=Plasmopara halstedii TaxID=4781 RepID=A0A0P1AR05_PLAHL|nr:pyruvate kinase [Plasmopara halstedii]CEG43953.1 pyruvate kinase [Plasmopara halstedii]|eukprot:XP_024580322.1 pyruvate kinase [Plasmopara halstedii]
MSGAIGLSRQGVELDSIMRNVTGEERKTKIFCTLGPACWSQDGLGELIDAGMNVARLNFSHGDHVSHADTLNRLRGALASRPHKNIAVMLDTKGPEIRTGFLANKDKVTIQKNAILELTTDYNFLGDETKIACSYPELPQSVQVGGSILVADGSLVLTVVEIKDDSVVCRAKNTATLGERKNMNLPGCKVMLPTLTEKDEDDLVNFGLMHGVDYIAASFVRTGQDIDNIRKVLGPRGRSIKIIAKIESQEGLENFDEILAKTDGIMVARGDLGMEIPPEKVFLAQKMMIRKANIAGKPIVTATQMLESMIKAPRPTRAECTDVANAVLDGTDAVMLSGETANGDYPTEAVGMMARICVQAEGAIHYDNVYQSLRNAVLETYGPLSTQEAIASSAVKTAIDIKAKMIVVLTESGATARLVSKFRPSMPVLVLTAMVSSARQAEGFYKGVRARCMGSMIGTESILYRATDLGKQYGWVQSGDNVVALHGTVEARSGSTDMLKSVVQFPSIFLLKKKMLQRLRHAVGWGLPAPPPGTRVDFQVCAALGHGQTLWIVGDLPLLGGSVEIIPNPSTTSTENGLQLVTTPELYPIWYNLEPIVAPSGTIVHYRYAIVSGSRFLRYEGSSDGGIITRELTIGSEYIQTQDTLDGRLDRRASIGSEEEGLKMTTCSTFNIVSELTHEDEIPSHTFWNAIPRLSSGQAFVDRRANGNEDGTFHRLNPTIRRSFGGIRQGNTENTEVNQSSEMKRRIQNEENINLTSQRLVDDLPCSTSPRSMTTNVTMEATDGVIIAVHRLPVLVHRTIEGHYHIEWEDDNLICPSGLMKDSYSETNWDQVHSMRLTWVGTVHCAEKIPKEDEERLAKQLEDFHCVPVFLSEPLSSTFHNFCYGTLWPVFHNIVDVYGALPTRWWNPSEQRNAWASYKTVNRIFVNKVIEVYNEGDLVWLHGLHLLVAPSFLTRRLPCVNVGIFLHTPFPSSEIFRTLSMRADLLRGVLAADHIGFHLYEYARHFLTSCRRILGLKYSAQPGGYIGVEYNGRMVMLTISHIGIEPTFIDRIHSSELVEQDTATLAMKYERNQRTIYVSIDRVERLKGILLKLGAIEFFLARHEEYVDKVQFVQIGIWDSSNPSPEKDSVRAEILAHMKRINDRFGANRLEPLFAYSEVENTDMASRLPLWRVGHVLLTTSVRDAVNLYPFEFIYAHELAKSPGVVIVSEFSGSSRVLTGSIGVNPWKREEIVQAMELALTMSQEERKARHDKDFEYIITNSRTKWAERILVDLKRTKKQTAEGEHMGYGLGLGFRMLEFNAGFKMLETEVVAKAYRETFRRVLFFDYGNTLTLEESTNVHNFVKYISGSEETGFVSKSETPKASSDLLASLTLLCADPRNTVFVLSGKERLDLEQTLGNVRGLGLAAEHGYLYKWGTGSQLTETRTFSNLNDDEGVWLCTKDNFDDSWKDVTHAVMDIYTQRTHGTYIELKGSALLWQYRDADPEFGQLQAKELHDQLLQVLEHFQVEVVTGIDYLEVRPEGVDKGVIVDRVMSTIESTSGQYVDFILCIGDDLSDELMFQYLEGGRSRRNMFTVTVGKKPSAAKYFVNDVEQVMEIVHAMTKVSTSAKRNFSMNDLRLFDQHLVSSGAFQRPDIGQSRQFGYMSEGSIEGIDSDHEESNRMNLVTNHGITNRKHELRSGTEFVRNSMSMTSLSTVTTSSLYPTSSTYEQYLSNVDEAAEEEEGGIFF